jgi:antitoxin FitA
MANVEPPMSSVTIRKIDPAVKEKLRLRAARHSRSMEGELRAIITAALQDDAVATPNLADANRRRFAPLGGVDLEPHPYVTPGAPPAFEP